MKKLLAVLLVLVLLGACAAPVVVVEPTATTEEIATTLPAPREWPDVPQAYWAVLDNWYGSPRIGYALVDINGDGVEELLILQEWHDGFLEIWSIYTQDDGEDVNLVLYRPTSSGSGRLAEDGTLFMYIEWRDDFGFTSHRLESGATALTQITGLSRIVGVDDDGELIINYYRNTLPITAEEFYAAHERYAELYRNPPNPMQFEFIPLGQP